jgi:mRNA interferase HigB
VFWKSHPDAEQPLLSWHEQVKHADWQTPAEVKAAFGSASILRGGRVVFNIAGNKYRLVAWINHPYRVVYIRFVGTHKQYDQIDAQNI